MSVPCVTCTHPKRAAIDAQLAAGRTLLSISAAFGVGAKALSRHRDRHLSPALLTLSAESRQTSARSALSRIEALARRLERALDSAEADGRTGAFLSAARELRSSIELLARLSGELKPDGVQVQVLNLQTSPEWVELRSAVLHALEPFPEARAAVADAIAGVPQARPVAAGGHITRYRPDDGTTALHGAREGTDDNA
ncbi:MAG: hypothetical protein ACLQBX_06070 [Candidatus Limnocylindrales bacterium]